MKVAENACRDLTNIGIFVLENRMKNNQIIFDDIYSLFLFISKIVPGPYGLKSGGHQNSFSLLKNREKKMLYTAKAGANTVLYIYFGINSILNKRPHRCINQSGAPHLIVNFLFD